MKERGSTKFRIRIELLLVLVTFAVGLSLPVVPAISAEKFPVKPITIIVPYSAGGTTDLDARLWAQHMPKHLGQPVVVENQPGGAAVRGTLEVKKAKPDGYTLGMFGYAFLVAPYTLPNTHNLDDFIPLAQVMTVPYILGSSERTGFKSLKELVDYAKKNPKKVLAGMNKGTGDHINMVMAMKTMGIEPNYIPSGSGAERAADLAGGHLQLSMDSMSSFRSYVEAQKVRALGVTTSERVDLYKDVPTFKEQGFDLVSYYWEGLFVPKGTPPAIIQALESAIEKTSKEPAVIDQFRKNLQTLAFMKSDDFKKFIAKENDRIRDIIQEIGLMYKPGSEPAKK
jgi:tripartite-type tricarboxylate transporter receptor subunit TctC